MIPDSARSTAAAGAGTETFWQRRWDPCDPTGRSLTLGLIAASLGLVIFLLVAAGALWSSRLAALDRQCDHSLRASALNTPLGNTVFADITEIGGTHQMVWMAVLIVVVVYLSGYRWLALILLLAAVGGAFLDRGLKEVFHLPRPPLELSATMKAKAGLTKPSYGFPSGHSMGAMVGYGLLAYLLVTLILRRRSAQVTMIAFLALTILLIGFSRLCLHAHFLSQVLAGFAFGVFWLSLAISILEVIRRKHYCGDGKVNPTANQISSPVPPEPPSSTTPGGWQLANR